jgi:hypothetical protein
MGRSKRYISGLGGRFLLLIIGARWSAFCWRIATDPVWDKVLLGFYFCLRNVGPLRRWVMARWFDAVRRSTSGDEQSLPVSLSIHGGLSVCMSTNILERQACWQRLWVQGNPGMGKTALVEYLRSMFFANQNLLTLQSAFARFRCIPIIIPLREYRGVPVEPNHPEHWVGIAARMAVSAFGLTFEDQGLFWAMIKSGAFLLILDGANEVDRENEIELFARSAPAARILVTSQSRGSDYFTNWLLPNTITEEIEPLLCLFLGEAIGRSIFVRIKATPLLGAMRSGYDVRLIADLVESQGADVTLPPDRLGLYKLILAAIRMADGSQFPEERLCKAAWNIWCAGERESKMGRVLDEQLLIPLIREGQKVLRIIEGQQFEFRHDQMRAYLAARWAAYYEVHPIGLFEKETAIWRRSCKAVWDFFAEMFAFERQKDTIAAWKWSTEHPDRVLLQHALQNALREAGLDPELVACND